MNIPFVFDEFFASGREESVSPFLTPLSRKWGKNLSLKSALSSAAFLLLAFSFSFANTPLCSLFLSIVYFLSGIPAFLGSLKDLKNLEINIDVLMTLSAFIAIAIGSGLEGALLLVLFELSHGIEDSVSQKAKSALHNLNTLAPPFCHVVDLDGTIYEKAVREVEIGTSILVKNGEVVPLDGKVFNGKSSVNLVHLTGESLPVFKQVGDEIPSGARNLEAALTIKVTRTNSDSTLTRIIQLILAAQTAKPRLQRWLDRFGKHYASLIIALTFLFALSLPLFFAIPYTGKEGAIYRALAFLIAASPCALIIATPTAYLSAMSACAKRGVLLKGGVTLDALAQCGAIAFDKTGTLTTGQLQCSEIEPVGNPILSIEKALSVAYGLERQVVHPIASAICKIAEEMGVKPIPIENFKAIPGKGVQGFIENGVEVTLGIPLDEHKKSAEIHTLLRVGSDQYLFRFIDTVRKETADVICKIKTTHHMRTLMLTGDHLDSAQKVGKEVGIDEIFAELKPEDKLSKVAFYSDAYGLAMVGDGINDAPALARATVGISMGKIGSATAVDASDVVLLNDDLFLLPWLFQKADKTLRVVKQNLALALSVICFVTLPALFGLVPIWVAVLLHEGGTVLVGLNSLRLLKR